MTLISFLHNLLQTILFVMFFFSLRSRCGGFHLNSFISCYVCSLLLYIIISFASPLLVSKIGIVFTFTVIAGVYILIVGAINHPNIQLSKEEYIETKKSSRWVITLELFFIILSIWYGVDDIYIIYTSFAIILCAILVLGAKITGQEVKSND